MFIFSISLQNGAYNYYQTIYEKFTSIFSQISIFSFVSDVPVC